MTDTITPVIVRIVMRYLSAALVAWGVIAPEAGLELVSDPDLQAVLLIAVGSLVAFVTEYAYSRARATGGAT